MEKVDAAVGTTVGGSMLLNFLLNVLLGGALGKMWEMINTLQIIYYMPLIQAGYTSLLKRSLKIIDFVNGDFDIPGSSYILKLIVDPSKLED